MIQDEESDPVHIATYDGPVILLHPTQADFLNCDKKFVAFVGGIGSGKSFVLCYDLLARARAGGLYMAIAPTYPMLRDSTFRSFTELARRLGIPFEMSKTEHRVTLTGHGAEILFRSADNPETLRGPNLSGVCLDEASLMHRDVYNISIGRLRQGTETGFLRAAFTPKGPSHWTHEIFTATSPDVELIRAKTLDNPFNPPDFEATIRKQYGESQWMRQELEGEFVQLEGAEWSAPLVYLYDEQRNSRRLFTDWPERPVAVVIALDPSKGVSDYVRTAGQRKPDYQAFAIVMMDKRGTIYVDIDANRESVTEMITRGLALAKEHAPLSRFVVEDNDGLGMVVTEFQRQLREQFVVVPLVGIRNTVNKIFRLRRLGGYLSASHAEYGPQLRIRDTPGGRLLIGQMLDFPAGDHDDCLDALELAVRQLEDIANPG